MKYTNIIFDFDGTLVDTRPGLLKSFAQMMKEMDSDPAPEKTISGQLGFPLAQIVRNLLKTEDEDIIIKASQLFRKVYKEKYISDNILYSGISNLLKDINNNSGRNFIVSNKIENFIYLTLDQYDLRKYFTYIKGTDGTDTSSKKADNLRLIMEKNNLDKSKTVIIGDTKSDIEAGKKNGILTIGILYGYGSQEELERAEADVILNNILEIKKFLIE